MTGPRCIHCGRQYTAEREAEARLRESCADLIKMVEAAHRQLGMWTDKNPRILKARAAIAKEPSNG